MKFTPVDIEKRRAVNLKTGNTVRVWQKIEDKGKVRLQAFDGLVIAQKHGKEPGATFTVRKIASGVGVERIFPLYSPVIDKIEIIRHAKVRRAKLYYIREKSARQVRRKMKSFADFVPVEHKKTIRVIQEAQVSAGENEDKKTVQGKNNQ